MKLRDMPEQTWTTLQGPIVGIEVVCDPFLPHGSARVFADAVFVRSLDDDIIEIFDHRPLRIREIPLPSAWMAP